MNNWVKYWADVGFSFNLFGYVLFILVVMICQLSFGRDIKMQLVHNDGKVPSITFPAGKLKKGGSCEFSTRVCRKRCPTDLHSTDIEKQVFEFFKQNGATVIADKILDELLDRNSLFLSWFSTGDCPAKMTEKISWIIHKLQSERVVQCGFTRNRALWDKITSLVNVEMGLTVGSLRIATKLCEKGLVAIPDYTTGWVKLYKGTMEVITGTKREPHHVSGCGGGSYMQTVNAYQDKPILVTHEADCQLCWKKERGCFAK